MSFNTIEELRKSRGNFDTLLNQVEKMSTTTTESNDDGKEWKPTVDQAGNCLLYTSPSPRDGLLSRMPSSA